MLGVTVRKRNSLTKTESIRRRECISIQDVSAESIVRRHCVKIWGLPKKLRAVRIRIVIRQGGLSVYIKISSLCKEYDITFFTQLRRI